MPGAPGAPVTGSSAPHCAHETSMGPHAAPHAGHFLFDSIAAGLKHMVKFLSLGRAKCSRRRLKAPGELGEAFRIGNTR